MTEDEQPLAVRLRERIARDGALTFRDFMEAALYDARGGYYADARGARQGRTGDYRTSPELGPLFAATFARRFAALHAELGSPAPFVIYEAGAGEGAFARVVLETLARDHPRAYDATRYFFDEAGGRPRARASRTLADFAERVEFRRLGDDRAPLGAGVVFSNELLDALPVHRVVMRGGRLREMCVGLDAAGQFAWVERKPSTPRLAEHFDALRVVLAEGQSAEVNLAAGEWIARASELLSRGFFITVDYGAESAELYDARLRPGGTLRAFRAHRAADDLLAHPGEQDITSTVNWTQIARAGESAGLRTVSLERQDRFLLEAGLLEQLETLTSRATDEAERASLRLAAREMILPGGLAQSFQVLVQQKP